jgi:tetratricopeptide (TPR) repeat protein
MGVVILAAAVAVQAASPTNTSPVDDPMIRGLRDRGLTTLLELYMKQKPVAAPVQGAQATGTAGGGAVTVGNEKVMLAQMEVTKGQAATLTGDREQYFLKARQYYEEAIAEANQTLTATTQADVRGKLRIQIIRLRLELANMIFQTWLKTDLDFLEITDRRAGDRAHATEILKTAADQFAGISRETQAILGEMDRMSIQERSKFFNTGNLELRKIERESKYDEAWVTYYYGWILTPDFKPASKDERSKSELLNDAITEFKDYAALPDTVSAKWYALMVIGLAYRDLGQYDEALQSLAQADTCNLKKEEDREKLKIRIVFERALTLLKKGDYAAAHKTIEDGRAFWGDKLNRYVYGLSLPLVEAEAWVDEGVKTDKPDLKAKGMAIYGEVGKKPNPWPILVQGILDVKFPEAAADVANAQPLTIWMKAMELMNAGKNQDGSVKDPKKLTQAADLFVKYAEKVGPKDGNYADAQYYAGACYLQLNRKTEAATCFYSVASGRPDFKYAPNAAKYYIGLSGEVYQEAKTHSDQTALEKTRAAYEKALKWFCEVYGKDDPDQQFFYAMVIMDGGRLNEAATEFAKVSDKAEHYIDARYWVPLCHLRYFREVEVPKSTKPEVVLTRARTVSKELADFTEFALPAATKLPDTDPKKAELLDWARRAYFNAGDILCYPEVALYADALPILTTITQKFQLDDEMKGNVLSLLINAYLKLGDLQKANGVLGEFLKYAKQDEVGPVLRGLFRSLIEEVRGMVERNRKDLAAQRVDDAKKLGEQLRAWLENPANNVTDRATQIENMRYDLAELYLAIGNFQTAQAIYHEIGGPKPWIIDSKKGEALKMDCVYGLARVYEGLAEAEVDPVKQKQLFETSFEIWATILQAIDTPDKDKDLQVIWDRRYHVYYTRFKSDPQKYAQEVYDGLRSLNAIVQPEKLGGKDPVLQKKYMDLLAAAAKIIGGNAELPAPAATATAPASTGTAAPAATPTAAPVATPTAAPAATESAPAATATAPAAKG